MAFAAAAKEEHDIQKAIEASFRGSTTPEPAYHDDEETEERRWELVPYKCSSSDSGPVGVGSGIAFSSSSGVYAGSARNSCTVSALASSPWGFTNHDSNLATSAGGSLRAHSTKHSARLHAPEPQDRLLHRRRLERRVGGVGFI